MNNIYGHDRAKKILRNILIKNDIYYYKKYIEAVPNCPNPARVHLLIGDSGCGKTLLVKTIFKDKYMYVDGSQLNPIANGNYSVKTIKKQLKKELLHRLEQYKKKTGTEGSLEGQLSRFVIFIDEFDKLCKPSNSDGWQEKTQSELLTMFDGDSAFSEVTIILAGAFTKMERPTKKASVGFNQVSDDVEYNIYDALQNYGCLTEILGRVGHFIELDKFDETDYNNIITDYILPEKKAEHRFFSDKELKVSPSDIKRIAEEAVKNKQGVRYCKRALDEFTLDDELEFTL